MEIKRILGAIVVSVACSSSVLYALDSGVLTDLGHQYRVEEILGMTADRLVSRDIARYWFLWDRSTRKPVLAGESPNIDPDPGYSTPAYLALRGNTLAVGTTTSTELYSAVDGTLLGSVQMNAFTGKCGLSIDGSYFWRASSSYFTIWSLAGEMIVGAYGDYSAVEVYATIDGVHIAMGPAGANVIEFKSLTGETTISPAFSGTFHSWCVDGGHFLTTVGTIVYAYKPGGQLEAITELPRTDDLGGTGLYVWEHRGSTMHIYRMGVSAAPALTISARDIVAAPTKIGIFNYGDRKVLLSVVNIRASSLPVDNYTTRCEYISAFGADDADGWAVAGYEGLVHDQLSAPVGSSVAPLGFGKAQSISGSASGRVAISVASDQILIYDINDQSKTLVDVLDYDAYKVRLTSDGTRLAAQTSYDGIDNSPGIALRVLELPSGNFVRELTYPYPNGTRDLVRDFDYSLDGMYLLASETDNVSRYPIYGAGSVLGPGGVESLVRISADGSASAVERDDGLIRIYRDGGLSGAVAGHAACWLDNESLLVGNEGGTDLYGFDGQLLSDLPLPELTAATVIDDTHIHSSRYYSVNVYNLQTGESVWNDEGGGDAVGLDYVVYATRDGRLHWQQWRRSVECFSSEHPDYPQWLDVGLPECWCYRRQCHGDADGMAEGGEKTGYFHVHFGDLNLLIDAWNIAEPPVGEGLYGQDRRLCADFGRDEEGGEKTGFYRVHFSDLNILLEYWNISEPPHGLGIPTDCGGTLGQ